MLGIPEAKLRVVAPDVGGGFGSKLDVYAEEALCLALARKLGRPVEVDGGALGGLPRDDPRPRHDPGDRAGRDAATARSPAVRVRRDCGDGRVPAARHAGHTAARRVALRRLLRRPAPTTSMHRRLHEHDADRRLPRRRPARGDVCDRARHGRARTRARQGPRRASPPELHPASSRQHARVRA